MASIFFIFPPVLFSMLPALCLLPGVFRPFFPAFIQHRIAQYRVLPKMSNTLIINAFYQNTIRVNT